MDSATLVEKQKIDDGRKLIGLLALKEIDVTAAAWVKTYEEGNWFLYIATETVDKKGLATAYREVYGVLRAMPEAWISASEVKLVGKSNPITKDILTIRGERTANVPTRYHGSFLGGIGVEDVYIYPPYDPLRLWFSVSYTRQGDTNNWQARTKQGDLFRDTKATGAVAYSTARWEGEPEGAEKQATVAVLLEVGPQFDDPKILEDPNVQRVTRREAATIADEMFKHHHPGAVIEHVDDEERHKSVLRRAQEAAASPKADALFIGCPYDGMSISVDKVNSFCHITPISTRRGIRLFVLLPPLKDWDRLMKGEITKEGPFEVLYPYERKFVQGGAEFHYCAGDEISKALADQ